MAPIVHRFRASLALLGLGSLLAACAGQGDIDRTQPDKVDKSIFLNADGSPRTFYYRQTVVGVPPTSAFAFEGTMGDLMKVRFDILEKFLIGYRSYDYAPGSESPYSTGSNNMDTPALMFAITSQFDVKREYNPGTGEQTNVISENITDRPWNERQYMRVDWSQNLVDPPAPADPFAQFFDAQTISTGFSVGEGDQAYINPNRPIVTKDYIDFTFNQIRTPDPLACSMVFDPLVNDGGLWGCGQAEITFRNSLLPVPPLTYVPLSYPDRQMLTDAAGQPIRYAQDPRTGYTINCTQQELDAAGLSGDDCVDWKLDRFAKFGYFRTVRQTYDRQVGATEEGRQYFINRWNIWQDAVQKDANGDPAYANGSLVALPIKDRQTRTITYYLNPEFPADQPIRDAAAAVIGDWNQAAKESVAGMQFAEQHEAACLKSGSVSDCSISTADLKTATASMTDIFVLKPNNCELANVQQWVSDHPHVVDLVKAKVATSTLNVESFAPADLLKACSALSAVTEGLAEGDPDKFTWQRNGDLRYSFLHWVTRPQPSGPLGYGPSSADPETGEIISAGAYIYGAALDTYAKFAVDSVNLANGNLDPDDLLSGKSISDVLAETHTNRLAAQAQPVTDATLGAARARMQSVGARQPQGLVKVGAGIDDQVIAKIKGTSIEKLLLNDDVLPGLLSGYQPGDSLPPDYFDQAMAQPWFSSQAREARQQKFQQLGAHGCVYMAEFADDAILATALKYNQLKLPPDDMFKAMRGDIFRGLADHEVGHTMGLRHNFAASTDALNYDDRYWQLLTDKTMSDTAKEQAGLSEFATASVMDYGARFNSDIRGLGKYDNAAIRFGYGELIDVIPQAQEDAWTGLNNDIFLNDYTRLPTEVGGLSNMSEAGTRVASYNDEINGILRGNSPYPEKPYKFCIDEWEGSLDCKTWDKGANQQEIVDSTADAFRNYYVFNAYKRGRTTWQIENYLDRMSSHYFTRYTEAFQFFFFYGNLLSTYYPDADLGKDMLSASIDALNALGTVLETPEPGLHCTTAYSPYVLTIPITSSDCLAPADPASTATLNLPDAKPYYLAFSDDTYYRITRAGSLYDKLLALDSLTTTEARFVRVDAFESANRYSINFYQVFQNEVLNLLSGVIRNDPSGYAGTMNGANFQPTPVVDVNTYGIVNAQTPTYAQPNAVHVASPVNKTIEYWALLYSLARLGSSWDSTLDFQNYIAIAQKGADDDFTVSASTPVKEFTHPATGIIYRAPAYTGQRNIGADVIDEMNVITGTPGAAGTVPVKYGVNPYDGSPLPDWYTAKAAMDQAAKGADQKLYSQSIKTFTLVDQLLGFQVDLVSDIRLFRKQILLLNGVIQ